MKQSKIKVITDYLKQYQTGINQIISIKKKKDNFIINCTVYSKSTIIVDGQSLQPRDLNLEQIYTENKVCNIFELKTYLIPTKDIKPLLPKKRKLPKIKKIHIS